MADLSRNGPVERDVEQAKTALKKGAYLLKYGRRGKPKFCPFRLSKDESSLIWYSGKEEKQLKLSCVSRIVPGQRTAIFQRYPRPQKEYQSFSLICDDRSLDLICKDKEEAEVWFTGLRALVSGGKRRKWKFDTKSEGTASSDANSPVGHTRKNSPLSSSFGSTESLNQVENLTRRCQLQEVELKHSAHQLQEAISIAGEETAKCKAAKEVIKSLTMQLKAMSERLPGGIYHYSKLGREPFFNADVPNVVRVSSVSNGLTSPEKTSNLFPTHKTVPSTTPAVSDAIANGAKTPLSVWDGPIATYGRGTTQSLNRLSEDKSTLDPPFRSEDKTRTVNTVSTENGPEQGVEWVEQDEQGVYITLTSLPGGVRDLKRVRFSRKRFSEKQAELWWQENKARVHKQYNVRVAERSVIGPSVTVRAGEDDKTTSTPASSRVG